MILGKCPRGPSPWAGGKNLRGKEKGSCAGADEEAQGTLVTQVRWDPSLLPLGITFAILMQPHLQPNQPQDATRP